MGVSGLSRPGSDAPTAVAAPIASLSPSNRRLLALASAGVEHDVVSYENVGHAFWSDMGQIEREESPQIDAYRRTTTFLREFFAR